MQGSGSAQGRAQPRALESQPAGRKGVAGTFTPQPEAEERALPCWPPAGPAGTFIVARMLWRSLSWMGWVGLAAVLVPLPELGAGLGLVTEAAAGAEGAGVARVEEVVEDGVAAADWLRELGERGQRWSDTHPEVPTAALPQTSLNSWDSRKSLDPERTLHGGLCPSNEGKPVDTPAWWGGARGSPGGRAARRRPSAPQ